MNPEERTDRLKSRIKALRQKRDALGLEIDAVEAELAILNNSPANVASEQQPAADSLLQHDLGVLSAPTGFGKTVLGAYLIAQRSVNALVLVPNAQLYSQWLTALNRFLEIGDEPPEKLTPKGRKKKVDKIGQFCGSKKNTSGLVDVATIQSLRNKRGEVLDFIKDYGLVIVDECHHVPAISFEPVLKHINARYVYGLTATPFRDDGHHALIFMQCGRQGAQQPDSATEIIFNRTNYWQKLSDDIARVTGGKLR